MLDILLIVGYLLLMICMFVLIAVAFSLTEDIKQQEEDIDYWRQQALSLNRILRLDEDVSYR